MDDEIWTPPTEAEMQIIKATRERNDKISNSMGKYLLQGYKMLDSSCTTCATILLQDKQKRLYCVGCSEIDSIVNANNNIEIKDAAKQRTGEIKLSANNSSSSLPNKSINNSDSINIHINKEITITDTSKLLSKGETVIKSTLSRTVENLENCQCVDSCIRYCTLIKCCADALISLKHAGEIN